MNKVLCIAIIAIALVSAGAAAAITMNYDPGMKTMNFDGIKMKVPENAKFVKSGSGFEDTVNGISVQTFKSSGDASDFLKTFTDAKVISVANLPANSIAFQQGDKTFILVTNGKEALCVGAYNQDLDVKMANSIIFSDGNKTKVNHGVMGIGKKLPKADGDFNFIINITQNANMNIFDLLIIEDAINNSTQLTEDLDNPNIDSNENEDSLVGSESTLEQDDSDDASNNNLVENFEEIANQQDTSGDVSDSGSNEGSLEGGASDSDSGSDSSGDLSKSKCEDLVKEGLPDGYSISKCEIENNLYVFKIEDSSGSYVGNVTVDPKTGTIDDSDLEL